MLEAWAEVDVTTWSIDHGEPRGKRPKVWLRDSEDRLWLRKEPRESRPTEPAIEALVLRLARDVGIDAPESCACVWEGAVDGNTKHGLVVRLFTALEEELSLGMSELGSTQGYDPSRHEQHSLDRIRPVLERLEAEAEAPILGPFAHVLAFDAWIGNADRHQENWGILRTAGRPKRLAPMFDPAACLGVELGDKHPLVGGADPTKYIDRCPSGFGDEKRLILQRDVVDQVRKWPEWRAGFATWLAAFANTMDTFEQVLRRTPPGWLPASKADLACRLLRARLSWLRERGRG